MALAKGCLATPEHVETGELVIFERASVAIDIFSEAATEFVLGSAVACPYKLVTGHHSVHTSQASLAAGERRIKEIQARLLAENRF